MSMIMEKIPEYRFQVNEYNILLEIFRINILL